MFISNPIRQLAIVVATCFIGAATSAQETARTNAPTAPADDVDIAADELAKNGALAASDADAFKAQARARLRQRDGTSQTGVCAEGDRAQCQTQLRRHVRDCDGEGRKQGGIANTEDAARVAASLMLSAGNSEGLDEAGAMIRTQLGKGWRAGDVENAVRDLEELRGQKRWHREARQMLHECVGDGSCSAEQAHVTLRVMRQASRRADLDARQVRREVCQALRDQAGQGPGAGAGRGQGGGKGVGQGRGGGKAMAGSGSGDELRQRLQRRLRLHEQDADGIAGSGEQKRHRYRRGMDGESRQGGGYGGGQSGGAGSGWGGGGGGGGPHGPGGN